MAERCPESNFIGKATLQGYRWQINQRHVANIVKSAEESSSVPTGQSDLVEGLVFYVTDKDRRTLDRKEGIKTGAYERVMLDVLLERHPKFAGKRTDFVLYNLEDDSDAINRPASPKETSIVSQEEDLSMFDRHDTRKNAMDLKPKPAVLSTTPPPSANCPAAEVEEIKAISYLSTKYAENGLIRREYVQRMKNAISDAVRLDVSRDFVQRFLEPYIHGDVYETVTDAREELSTSDRISQKILKERERKAKGGPALGSASGTRLESTTPTQKSDQPENSKAKTLRDSVSETKMKKTKKDSWTTPLETDLEGQLSNKE